MRIISGVIGGVLGAIVGCLLNYIIVQPACDFINCFVGKNSQFDLTKVGIIFIAICVILGIIMGVLWDVEAEKEEEKERQKIQKKVKYIEGLNINEPLSAHIRNYIKTGQVSDTYYAYTDSRECVNNE